MTSYEEIYSKIDREKRIDKIFKVSAVALGLLNIGVLAYMFGGFFR